MKQSAILACLALLGASCLDPVPASTDLGEQLLDASSATDAFLRDTVSSDLRSAEDAGQATADAAWVDSAQADAGAAQSECQDWQTAHPEWLWCDDFEDGQALSDKYPDTGQTGMSVSEEDAFAGSFALRQHYEAGQVDAGWVSFYFGDTLGGDYGPVQDDIYMRWYHKFEAGFQGPLPPKMARVTSIGPGWDKRFGVYYWISDDEIVADVSAQYSSQANSAGWLAVQGSGFSYQTPGHIGRWICHEMRVQRNTPGQADGAYTFWVDGELRIDQTGVDLVGSTDFHFNNAMLDSYWNGGSPVAQSRYYDNFVVSTQRIGCLGDS